MLSATVTKNSIVKYRQHTPHFTLCLSRNQIKYVNNKLH